MPQKFRYYQTEADNAICEELEINNKCIVKMFCGTGKSLLMRYCKVVKKQKLCVFVFPSLSLIDQFTNDYLNDFPQENLLKISSELESTTDPKEIIKFLKRKKNKIICITYQSYKTLLDNLGETNINVCIFDEAHHAVGETYQKLIFENELCEKQIFFTATPKNANGIIMYDREQLDAGMCGKLVYDYTYLDGVNEDYLNPFDIRVDFSTKDTNISLYESICRAIIASGNNRVLTFHSDVNTRRDKSVKNFVNENQFIECFNEFIEKRGFYKKITMVGLSSDISNKDRLKILKDFDETPDDEIYIICSCETIGEGIDTKNANMCVFIDPKSSFVKIIQNIGRIVRKQVGIDKPKSTILIPCWVDKEKYLECGGDREKCDEIIRQDINKDGNFNGILNVMSALRQEDEDIYDICLHYPDTYSPQEIRSNLEKQGYKIEEPIGEGYLIENLEYMIGSELDYEEYEDCDSDEEIISRVAEENNVCVEIHTTSLENPIEKYNSECKSGNIVRLYKTKTTTDDEEETETIYQPIVNKNNSKKNKDSISGPKREKRFNINVHSNSDIKVLWNISNNIDITQNICSCILDCEVVDTWFERLEELKGFINENRKRPSQKSKNEEEKKLGSWLSNQFQNYKNKKMNEERKIKWEEFIEEYKEYFKDLDEIWDVHLNELKQFINENKKKPANGSKNEEEKKLGSWISSQMQNYKDNKMNEEIKVKWEEFKEEYKEYILTVDEIWNNKFIGLNKFINDNDKLPIKESKNEIEKKLGIWLNSQKKNHKNNKMNEERKIKWEEFIEEYKEYFKDLDEIWDVHLNELKQFINNKKIPSQSSINEEEKILSRWLTNQNSNYKDNKMNEEKKIKWEEFKEEYKEYILTVDEIWNNKFIGLNKFINDNDKLPVKETKNEIEKKLGIWLSSQKKNYKNKKMNKERKIKWEEFIEEYKEYFKDLDEIWNIHLNELKQFINENKKKPANGSKNEEEKKLAKWLSHQITNYRNKKEGMKDENKRKIWDEFIEEYKEYFVTDDGKWDNQLNELKQFINKNKKSPSQHAKNEEEKLLGCWLNQRNMQYKNNEMKDEGKRKLWEEFKEKYKEYFRDFDEIWDTNFNKIKKFIYNNNKRPSHHSKNEEEKKIGKWLSHQIHSYKNKKFIEERKIIWKEFIDSYPDLFKKEEGEEEIEEPKEKKKKSMKLKFIIISKKENTEERKKRVKSEISILHQKYKTMNSQNLNKEFKENQELWKKYHEISEENEKSFPEEEIPRNRIIAELDKIKTKRTKVVVDMGCGKGQISEHFKSKNDTRFQFKNYDHISENDNVISCDISSLNDLEDDSVDICILSLAMWGSNCKEYVKEANRILESNGQLFIIEATKRWSEKDDSGNIIEGKEGTRLYELLIENGFQIINSSKEKFCLFVCVKR
jgi:superfamily II DNA or RNA helicase